MTPATEEKREQLDYFIKRVLAPEPTVIAVIGIGSIASGHMRPDSDIDAVVFLDPLDLYIIPAEAIWRPLDDTFHSIFDEVEGIQLDFHRLDWSQWSDPEYEWPEGNLAELSTGWIAYDPTEAAAQLIRQRTAYPEDLRLARLDEAIVWMDQHLKARARQSTWESLGPAIAFDRLEAAYNYLVQALFAYNRRWRIWRNREMQNLLDLAWLPEDFASRVLLAANGSGQDRDGYVARLEMLRTLFDELLAQLVASGDYSATPVDQAFIRSHEEPGRSWNMDEWNKFRFARSLPGQEGN
jgi:predicted nucleotidyltransferase